jgi:hypothetical protein
MSSKVKRDPLTTEQIAALSLELEKKKQALESSIVALRDKAHRIEVSLKENELIRQQAQELLNESLGYFQTEWTRKSEFYPEIRASILQKAIDSKGKT